MYLHLYFDKQIDPKLVVDILRINIAKTFHWTLAYIDSLSLDEITMIQGVLSGQAKYDEKMAKGA